MVLKGQYLERMAVIDAGDVTLEGLYHRGEADPPVVLAPPHPRFGGSMDAPVVAEVAWAVTRAGHATLRFNYRGVGASQGTRSSERDAVDLGAAIRHLEETAGASHVALVGYSYGAVVAAEAAASRRDVVALILISPPTAAFDLAPLLAAACARSGGQRSGLLVTGARDAIAPPEAVLGLAEAAGGLPVKVVPEADHAFVRGLPALGRLCTDFLAGLPVRATPDPLREER